MHTQWGFISDPIYIFSIFPNYPTSPPAPAPASDSHINVMYNANINQPMCLNMWVCLHCTGITVTLQPQDTIDERKNIILVNKFLAPSGALGALSKTLSPSSFKLAILIFLAQIFKLSLSLRSLKHFILLREQVQKKKLRKFGHMSNHR